MNRDPYRMGIALAFSLLLCLSCNTTDFDPTICPEGCPPNMECYDGVCDCSPGTRNYFNKCWTPANNRYTTKGELANRSFSVMIMDSIEYDTNLDRYDYQYFRDDDSYISFFNPQYLKEYGETYMMKRIEKGYADSIIMTDYFTQFVHQGLRCHEYNLGMIYGTDSIVYRTVYLDIDNNYAAVDTSEPITLIRWRP